MTKSSRDSDPSTLEQRGLDLAQRLPAAMTTVANHQLRRMAGDEFSIIDAMRVGSAFGRAWLELVLQPDRLWRAQARLAEDFGETNIRLASKFSGIGESQSEAINDRRFKAAAWSANPGFEALKNWYVALGRWMQTVTADLPSDEKSSQQVKFYTRQIANAFSPSNFLLTNPEALDLLGQTNGESLLRGFENLLDDIERGEGRLDINQTKRDAFVVGEHLACTPGKVIYQNDLIQLIQYEPRTAMQHRVPLLFVPAWINKYYILDLKPQNSLVRFMLDQGYTVFVISWANPTKKLASKSFEDYMAEGPLAALDAIEAATGEREVNVLGFCIGGILVTATLAYLAARGDDRIKSATTLATMVDFEDVGEIGVFIDHNQLVALERHMAEKGYLDAHHLQDVFSLIRENDLIWSFVVSNYLLGRDAPPFDLLFWNADATRLPAAMLLWYLRHVYLENGLRKPGGLVMKGVPIDVTKVQTPLFVLGAREDHIAPWRSIYPASQLFGGPVRFILSGSGHIAGVINPPSDRPKYGFWFGENYPSDPDNWLATASYQKGSWWPDWSKWLRAYAGEDVDARQPGSGRLPVLEDAPGTYVKAGHGDADE